MTSTISPLRLDRETALNAAYDRITAAMSTGHLPRIAALTATTDGIEVHVRSLDDLASWQLFSGRFAPPAGSLRRDPSGQLLKVTEFVADWEGVPVTFAHVAASSCPTCGCGGAR